MVEHPKSQSPQTGQVYFNGKPYFAMLTNEKGESQSPQTGQVYFNKFLIGGTNGKNKQSLNPLKRVKFISRSFSQNARNTMTVFCLNPLKRVKFISTNFVYAKSMPKMVSIPSNGSSLFQPIVSDFGNALWVLVSIPSNGSSLFQAILCRAIGRYGLLSQSPQTGQVYFNQALREEKMSEYTWSQSPQTGQVYFKFIRCESGKPQKRSQSPQTGQVYFNLMLHCLHPEPRLCLNPLKRVKFISRSLLQTRLTYVGIGLNPLKRVKFISS